MGSRASVYKVRIILQRHCKRPLTRRRSAIGRMGSSPERARSGGRRCTCCSWGTASTSVLAGAPLSARGAASLSSTFTRRGIAAAQVSRTRYLPTTTYVHSSGAPASAR